MNENTETAHKPTPAFIGASWAALLLGVVAYSVGLFNAGMELNEKGYYFTVLVFGLFAAVSLQKSVRDRAEGVPVTNLYFGIAWIAIALVISLMAIGLWNAQSLILSEKGFYGMAFVLSIFAAIAVQKNVRDLAQFHRDTNETEIPQSPAGDWRDERIQSEPAPLPPR